VRTFASTSYSIYCADIGSIKSGKFGWAHADHPTGEVERHRGSGEIAELADAVAADLEGGLAVALGFECPLFVPVPEDHCRLGAGRVNEGGRAWSAQAGAFVLAAGLAQVSWLLGELRQHAGGAALYVDWADFVAAGRGLFIWEAFVSGSAKTKTHVEDAAVAVRSFAAALPDPTKVSVVTAERPLSLAGAAALWSGWSADADLVRQPTIVLKTEA
jgi:hypothetical protein